MGEPWGLSPAGDGLLSVEGSLSGDGPLCLEPRQGEPLLGPGPEKPPRRPLLRADPLAGVSPMLVPNQTLRGNSGFGHCLFFI